MLVFVGLVYKHTVASCVDARIWQIIACDQARVRAHWGGALSACASTLHVEASYACGLDVCDV